MLLHMDLVHFKNFFVVFLHINTSQFIYSFYCWINSKFDCVHIGPVKNKEMNIFVHVIWCTGADISLGYGPGQLVF